MFTLYSKKKINSNMITQISAPCTSPSVILKIVNKEILLQTLCLYLTDYRINCT